VVWGIATQYLYQVLLMAIQVLVAPLLLKSKGSASLGGYAAIMQFVSYLALLDLGFTGTLGRYLSQSFSDESDGRKRFINFFNIGRWYLFSVCFVSGLVIAFSSLILPQSMGLNGSIKTDAIHALLILAVWYSIKFYFTMFYIALYASHQMKIGNICLTIGMVVRFSLTILFIRLNYGITGIVIANVSGDFSAALLQMIFFKIKFPFIRFSWRVYNKAIFKELFSFGINTFMINIAARIVQSSTTFVAGIMLGAIAAAHYYSMSSSVFIVFTFISVITFNLLPSMNEMVSKGNFAELRKIYISAFRLNMTLLIPSFMGFLLFHQYVTTLWVGSAQYEGFYYTVILNFYLIVITISNYNENVIIVLGNIKWYGRLQIISTVIGLSLSIAGAHFWGLKGVVAGNLITISPAGLYAFYRLLKQMDLKFSLHTFMPPLRFILIVTFITSGMLILQNKGWLKITIVEVIGIALIFGLLIIFEGIEKERRRQFTDFFLKLFKR
jgi:O-antigen/teichoic acid export membrane protein